MLMVELISRTFKDLAGEFKVRIELRQIGPREGAKFIGGLGPCDEKPVVLNIFVSLI